MKKKIIKLWGIGMVVVLMASLLIIGATPASAATLAWSGTGLPGGFNQVAATDAAIVKVAPNGDIFVVDQQPTTLGAGVADRIYKSTDGGQTWVTGYVAIPAPVEQFPVNYRIVDLVVSPSYATDNTVFVVGNDIVAGPPTAMVFRSINGGLNFLPFGVAIGAGTEVATCIDIDPNYNNAVGGSVMVGTANGAGAGDVYVWTTGGFAWIAQGLAEDVYAAAFSPSYGLDATIVVLSVTGAGARLHHEVGLAPFGTWDPTSVGTPPLDLPITVVSAGALPANMVTADIAIPDGYNASVPATRSMYVAINTGGAGGTDTVYRCFSSGPLGVATALCPAFVYNPAPNIPVRNIDFSGTNSAGTLAVGLAGSSTVWVSNNPSGPSATVIFTTSINPPTPLGALNAYVALSNTYSADTTIYVGTSGGAALDESAVSISTDGGANWAQIGLIDTTGIIGGAAITDFQPASNMEWYLVTASAASLESLWKTTNGGLTWLRITTLATTTNVALVRLSQNYAADNTLYFLEEGPTAAAPLMQYSGNGGASWEGRPPPAALGVPGAGIADMVVVDQFTLYIGDGVAGTIYRSINAGWLWTPQVMPLAAGVRQIAYDAASGALLAGDVTGGIYLNDTGLAWTNVGVLAGVPGSIVIAFDANYATNSMFYAGDPTGAVAGVWAYTVGGAPPIASLDGGLTAACMSIESASDGTVYAADGTASTAGVDTIPGTADDTGGLVRILPLIPPLAERVGIADGLLPVGANLGVLFANPGGDGGMSLVDEPCNNTIYVIENSGATPLGNQQVLTYTDILSCPSAYPAVTSPEDGAIVLAGAAAVAIEPIAAIPFPGGTYIVQWDTRPDWLGVGNVLVIPATINSVNLNNAPVGPALPAGTTIYYRVSVIAPVNGPWSPTMTLETQLTAGTINAPPILSPSENGTGPGGWDAELNPTFSWGVIAGATNYEFQLATDAGMIDLIVDATGVDALGNVLVYTLTDITLDYNTTYYWRVRAISATSETEWSAVVGFTTMAEPPPPSEPPTFTQPPEVTFTVELPEQPTPTTVEVVQEEVSQGYIWAIIIIGAVLVIAVIVLIVRTRRSV
jgi:hypothetical protein